MVPVRVTKTLSIPKWQHGAPSEDWKSFVKEEEREAVSYIKLPTYDSHLPMPCMTEYPPIKSILLKTNNGDLHIAFTC